LTIATDLSRDIVFGFDPDTVKAACNADDLGYPSQAATWEPPA
jgi:hypothetical protein